MKKLPAQPISGLMDGIAVLQELTLTFEPLSTIELSIKTGMEKTRVNRILKTLDFMDLAYRTQDRKYAVGSGIHVLAAQSLYASGLIQLALKHLEPLQSFGLVVALGFLAEDRVCYLYHWQQGISSVESLGRLAMFPVEKSSIGIALLAHKELEFIEKVKTKILLRKGSIEQLDKDILHFSENGFSKITENNHSSLAVCLGDPVFAAIAFSGQIDKSKELEFISMLKETVYNIESEIKTSKPKI